MHPSGAAFARRALGYLIAALVWPLPTRFGSALALDLARESPSARPRLRIVHGAALVLFPAVFAGFAALLVINPSRYSLLLMEDQPVEWATVAALVVAAVLAAANAAAERRASPSSPARW